MNRPRKPARPTVIRAIAYTRVSTEDQAESGAGLQSQEQALIAEIERRGWQLVKVADDPAEHGSTSPDKRPGFAEALGMLAAGEADAIVAKKVDRVCRSVQDFYNLDARSQREGWQLVTLDSDPTHTGRPGDAGDARRVR